MNLDLLLQRAREQEAAPESFSPNEVAALALSLARVHSCAANALEGLKERLRIDAASLREPGTGYVTLEPVPLPGVYSTIPLECVTVTFPQSYPALKKDCDVPALQETLGDAFDLYFETRTSYVPRKSLPETVQNRMQDHLPEIEALIEALTTPTPTPRVGFKLKD